MRTKLVLCLFSFAILIPATAEATPFPIGVYTLSATTPTSGIHSGSDEGTLSGTLTFDAASNITSADLLFNDTTSGMIFSFTNPGPVSIFTPPGLLAATIYNAVDPSEYYAFSIRIPSNPSGSFTLTCGTDCDNWMLVKDGGPSLVYVEVAGAITPVPEPSSFAFLGTGLIGAFSVFRRIVKA